ncbi:MAG: hypothetical protein ACRDFY_10550 [Candidatus Limnocylindria bacterium]
MSLFPRRALLLALLTVTACTADVSPSPTPSPAPPTPTVDPTAPEPSATASVSPASPSATPEPPLSLALPETTDPRVISASVTPDIGAEGGSLIVVVTSAASERIDEVVLRWPAELEATLRLAPFVPSDARINDGAPPLNQPWTKWVVGPGEQGEPAGTISLGWGPLLPGATLTIPIFVTRVAAGPVAFDLQLLARNDLLTLDGGAPAELRVEVP